MSAKHTDPNHHFGDMTDHELLRALQRDALDASAREAALGELQRRRLALPSLQPTAAAAAPPASTPAAIENDDFAAYQIAMMRFVVAIGDGHVSVEPNLDYVLDQYGGGLGLTLGESDDGQVIVTSVAGGSPAEEAGLAPGFALTTWNGEPIAAAIGATR